jgi:FAD binding domain
VTLQDVVQPIDVVEPLPRSTMNDLREVEESRLSQFQQLLALQITLAALARYRRHQGRAMRRERRALVCNEFPRMGDFIAARHDAYTIGIQVRRRRHANGLKTVRAEAGLKLGEFDRETQAFGLATTLGVVPDTGISGLTLGGGFGNLMAMYGLALDTVIGVDVVTADGRLLPANDSENSDLFWGVRGSSGNLGIATSLEYRLHEVRPVLGGAVFYPLSKTKEVLLYWREFAETLPDEVVLQGAGLNLPDGTPVFAIVVCYCGSSMSEGERVLQPRRKFGSPLTDAIQVMSYAQIQGRFQPFFPPGRRSCMP